MISRAAALVVFLCACGPSQLSRTSRMIGCATGETEITQPGEDEWDARCRGTSTFQGPGSPKEDRRFACKKTKGHETCVEVYPQ